MVYKLYTYGFTWSPFPVPVVGSSITLSWKVFFIYNLVLKKFIETFHISLIIEGREGLTNVAKSRDAETWTPQIEQTIKNMSVLI